MLRNKYHIPKFDDVTRNVDPDTEPAKNAITTILSDIQWKMKPESGLGCKKSKAAIDKPEHKGWMLEGRNKYN